jgi:hypothetical protein
MEAGHMKMLGDLKKEGNIYRKILSIFLIALIVLTFNMG